MAFTKIKFTCVGWRLKKNYGTKSVVIKDSSNKTIFELYGGDHYVCASKNGTSTKEFTLPYNFSGDVKTVTFVRYLDAEGAGNGNASMRVELYDDILQEWVIVLDIPSGYRTRPWWTSGTWNGTPKVPYDPPKEIFKSISLNNNIYNKEFILSTIKWTTPAIKIFNSNNVYYGKLSTQKPSYKTITATKDSKKYYLVDKLGFENFILNKNYTYQTVESGSYTTKVIENISLSFECTSRPEGSHKGNNGSRTGNIYVKIKKLDGSIIINKTFVMWDYLGGDSKKYINNYVFYSNNFKEPVIAEISWILDVGYYVAHIWGERYGVSVINYLKLNVECNK
jgi:hypothetical protein